MNNTTFNNMTSVQTYKDFKKIYLIIINSRVKFTICSDIIFFTIPDIYTRKIYHSFLGPFISHSATPRTLGFQ